MSVFYFYRKENRYMKKICISCGKEIVSGLFYQGDFVSLCEECGSEELAYADSIDSYVFEGDLKDCYSDDELRKMVDYGMLPLTYCGKANNVINSTDNLVKTLKK